MAARVYHYKNESVEPFSGEDVTTDYYDGEPQFIPARGTLVLVPCCSEDPLHKGPSNECVLITRTSYCKGHNDFPFVAFFISNDTDIGLLIRRGDQLGDYYPVPHQIVRAQRTLILHSHYIDLVEYGHRCYTEPIEEDEDEDEVTIITPPPRPSSPGFPHHQVSSCLRHQPPLQCMIRPASRTTILPLPFLNKYFNPFATQGQKRQPIPSTVTPCLECFPPKRVTVDVKRMKNYFKETQEKDQQQQPLAQDVETPSR
jgi:hypothetical protein